MSTLASDVSSISDVSSGTPQQSVMRRLTQRYALALGIVAMLTILGQVSVQLPLAQQKSDARVINTAALQVTLSERLAKDALAIETVKDASSRATFTSELISALAQWQRTQVGLQRGDPSLGLPGNSSPQVSRLYQQIAPDVTDMLDAATEMVVVLESQPPVPLPDAPSLSDQVLASVSTLLADQPAFTKGMNAIIAQYQREAEGRVAALQTIGLILLGVVLVVLALVVFRPVTSQVGESVAELVRARERERELAALKDQFIIDANHELRTPIMALYNNLEILQALGDRAQPDQRTRVLQRAITSGDAVLRLLTSVLDTGALEGRAPKLDLVAVPLAPMIRQVLETFDPREIGEPGLPQSEYEGRPVTVNISTELTVVADEGRLRQILINLLANALKYSSPGTPIEIRGGSRGSGQGEELARISVSDKGLGVPPRDVHKLFNRLVRLERDIAGPVRGTGVGLYMCRVLVEAMGGQIWVESRGIPGEGSTFSFTLPLARSIVAVRG
jgi:signal transduction histidine kinase